ncbi:beta-glucosidase [Brachybacterium ginsengisoli]|uniref:Beta-glucosidase n=1 Tax=Brachybacterium ginsengisoli TaxID=1331682 RepID=A0A291H140_9MICO|nr:glycoside hydrolase family 3 C-terminal domain-containing protein [Brachybacterium ginsengisoli]ATG56165.1 beta-glucosidase [Brachybacterium ginsengisoli]
MTDILLSQHTAARPSAASTVAVDPDPQVAPALADRARALAAQGAILLHNDGALPLPDGSQVALFGRTQKDWIAVGYGSGGDVNAPYVTTLLDSLREGGAVQVDEELAARYEAHSLQHPADPGQEWGQWPRSFPEPEIADAEIAAAARRSGTAVVVIGRAAGEDRDNVLEPGAYYLSAQEESLLARVSTAFDRTVALVDTGNVIDLAWVADHALDAVVLAWSGGMEGGRAVADVLTGAVEPGGRLTDTIARRYEDYPSAGHFGDPEVTEYVEDVFVGYRYFETFAPEKVLFPFGHGLGYTTFDLDAGAVEQIGGTVALSVDVTNTGARSGSEVVQVYAQGPDGTLPRPARALVAFARTPALEPGASCRLDLSFPLADLASYDDSGASGHRSAWVLEPGDHRLHLGTDVRRAAPVGAVHVPRLQVVRQLEEVAAVRPEHAFDRMTLRRDDDGRARVAWEQVPTSQQDLRRRILDRLPAALERIADPSASFTAVLEGSATLEEFVARLSDEELESLAYGDLVMDSPLGAPGNAGVLGGVTEALRARGVPPVTTTDGPSGLRLAASAALLPCGTALASSWDPAAVRELAELHGREMVEKGSDMILAPGMNIHRDPLCGRNFEYFAEDPLLTGAMATAIVTGVQSQGVSACPKHFAANNQETRRTVNDSRVSERALREIYLRGFEIMVREARPQNLMTSYNRINGVWGHYHYDLVTTVLRGEWEYDGNVVTDWWMHSAPDPLFPALRDSAYRVRAQVDVLMPGAEVHFGTTRDDAIRDSLARPDGLTVGELQRTAGNVLRYLARSRGVEPR